MNLLNYYGKDLGPDDFSPTPAWHEPLDTMDIRRFFLVRTSWINFLRMFACTIPCIVCGQDICNIEIAIDNKGHKQRMRILPCFHLFASSPIGDDMLNELNVPYSMIIDGP